MRIKRLATPAMLSVDLLDGELGGVIDQVNGLLDLSARTGGGAKKYAAVDVWAHNLLRITDSLDQPMA